MPGGAVWRQFSAKYKDWIIEKADACEGKHGALGELLRKEGAIPASSSVGFCPAFDGGSWGRLTGGRDWSRIGPLWLPWMKIVS